MISNIVKNYLRNASQQEIQKIAGVIKTEMKGLSDETFTCIRHKINNFIDEETKRRGV